jgi:hypothetical protein
LTLGSSALAVVALIIRPQDILQKQTDYKYGFVGLLALAAIILILLFDIYRRLTLPSLVDLPDPNSIELAGKGTQNHAETLADILESYTQSTSVALDLYERKTSLYTGLNKGIYLVFISMASALFVGAFISIQ